MANEPDGAKDNLDVIRELLRRLEEAAHSRTLAAEPPSNANRELASLPQRSPPTRLAPASPPGARGFYPSLQTLPGDPAARWRLPVVAMGAYALGVVTTLAATTYYDRIAGFTADLLTYGQPQTAKKVAVSQPELGRTRAETPPAKEPADRPAAIAQQPPPEPKSVAHSDPQPQVPVSVKTPAQPARSETAPQATAPASVPAKSAAPAPTPPTPAPSSVPAKSAAPAPTAPAAAPQAPVSPQASTSPKPAPSDIVAKAPPTGAPTTQTDGKAPPVRLKLAPRIDAKGGERATFPVGLEPMPSDADALLLVVRGVPEEIALSQGSAIGNEIWLIPAHMSRGMEFTVAEAATGTFDVTAELVTLDGRLLSQARTRIVATPTLLAAPAAPGPTPAEKLDADTIRRLTARGELLLDTGDIGAARIVLERAAEAGSAIAALRLGETYDPVYLRRSGTQSDAGDEAQALRWYERAERLGSTGAAERLGELRKR
jgi:hypothetical protein